MTVRTRFAPSPTGDLHLGNLRTAVLNWAFARRHDGAFVLRFEDTDVERNVEASEERIREALDWVGIAPDEGPFAGGPHGPYRQSERGSLYRERAASLLLDDRAYPCYCTPAELQARREAALEASGDPVYDGRCRELSSEEQSRLEAEGRRASVRFRVDPGPVTFEDRIRGEVTIEGSEFGDFVILRSDGRPTYNFAVVVDDVALEISHVIRGVGHLSNTPGQVLLYRALEVPVPEFVHIPHVRAPGGGELSKRADARSVLDLRDEGYHPAAVVNYLSLLSWSSETGDEVLSRERIVEEVDLDRVGRSDAEIDPEKMRWLSGRHIRREAPERLAGRLDPFLADLSVSLTERDRIATAEVLGGRIQLLAEARKEVERIFPRPGIEGEAREALEAPGAPEVLRAAARSWEATPSWEREALARRLDAAREDVESAGAAFYHPLRVALTGRLKGPEVPNIAYMLGRDRTLRRLRRALEEESTIGKGSGDVPT